MSVPRHLRFDNAAATQPDHLKPKLDHGGTPPPTVPTTTVAAVGAAVAHNVASYTGVRVQPPHHPTPPSNYPAAVDDYVKVTPMPLPVPSRSNTSSSGDSKDANLNIIAAYDEDSPPRLSRHDSFESDQTDKTITPPRGMPARVDPADLEARLNRVVAARERRKSGGSPTRNTAFFLGSTPMKKLPIPQDSTPPMPTTMPPPPPPNTPVAATYQRMEPAEMARIRMLAADYRQNGVRAMASSPQLPTVQRHPPPSFPPTQPAYQSADNIMSLKSELDRAGFGGNGPQQQPATTAPPVSAPLASPPINPLPVPPRPDPTHTPWTPSQPLSQSLPNQFTPPPPPGRYGPKSPPPPRSFIPAGVVPMRNSDDELAALPSFETVKAVSAAVQMEMMRNELDEQINNSNSSPSLPPLPTPHQQHQQQVPQGAGVGAGFQGMQVTSTPMFQQRPMSPAKEPTPPGPPGLPARVMSPKLGNPVPGPADHWPVHDPRDPPNVPVRSPARIPESDIADAPLNGGPRPPRVVLTRSADKLHTVAGTGENRFPPVAFTSASGPGANHGASHNPTSSTSTTTNAAHNFPNSRESDTTSESSMQGVRGNEGSPDMLSPLQSRSSNEPLHRKPTHRRRKTTKKSMRRRLCGNVTPLAAVLMLLLLLNMLVLDGFIVFVLLRFLPGLQKVEDTVSKFTGAASNVIPTAVPTVIPTRLP